MTPILKPIISDLQKIEYHDHGYSLRVLFYGEIKTAVDPRPRQLLPRGV
jgi:hypothetical protein